MYYKYIIVRVMWHCRTNQTVITLALSRPVFPVSLIPYMHCFCLFLSFHSVLFVCSFFCSFQFTLCMCVSVCKSVCLFDFISFLFSFHPPCLYVIAFQFFGFVLLLFFAFCAVVINQLDAGSSSFIRKHINSKQNHTPKHTHTRTAIRMWIQNRNEWNAHNEMRQGQCRQRFMTSNDIYVSILQNVRIIRATHETKNQQQNHTFLGSFVAIVRQLTATTFNFVCSMLRLTHSPYQSLIVFCAVPVVSLTMSA